MMKKMLLPSLGIITAVVVLVGGAIALTGYGNHKVDAGQVGYVSSDPLTGAREYIDTVKGPGGTGLVWRQRVIPISVTPYTNKEVFTDIHAADNLKMRVEAFLVCRVDANKVKQFVEEYGAASDFGRDVDAIYNDAYKSFIQPPFTSAVRAAIGQYNGLDAPTKLPELSKLVAESLREQLKNSPFIVDTVTIGSTTPPDSVIEGVTAKVEATQIYAKQAIELDIAKRNEQIAVANGKAIANKMEQEAIGQAAKRKAETDAQRYEVEQQALAMLAQRKAEAEGNFQIKKAEADGLRELAKAQEAQSKAIGDNLIRLEAVRNLDKLKVPTTSVNVGGDAAIPAMNIIKKVMGE